MPVTLKKGVNTTGYKDKKANRFIASFKAWIKFCVAKGTDENELTPIMDDYAKTLYSNYNLLMGKWFNKPNPKSGDAKWLDNLGKDLKKHDNKFVPKYRKLKDKIDKTTKPLGSVKEEAKKLFQDAWNNLEKILKKAASSAQKIPGKYEYKNGGKKETYENLVCICKGDIENLIGALKYEPNDEELYEQLELFERAETEDATFTFEKKECNASDEFKKALGGFFDGLADKGGSYDKNFAPILLKSGSLRTKSESISGLFSEYFNEFLNRGKGGKTSHTAKWCRSVLEDIQKHEKKFKPKYFALRKEINAFLKSKPNPPSECNIENKDKAFSEYYIELGKYKKKADSVKAKAIKLFEDARKSLQGVFDKAAKSAKRTLVKNSTVYANHKEVQKLADDFRKVKPTKDDNDALWNILTKGKFNQ